MLYSMLPQPCNGQLYSLEADRVTYSWLDCLAGGDAARTRICRHSPNEAQEAALAEPSWSRHAAELKRLAYRQAQHNSSAKMQVRTPRSLQIMHVISNQSVMFAAAVCGPVSLMLVVPSFASTTCVLHAAPAQLHCC